MKKVGLIIPFEYRLLSIAAILDVLETTNRLCVEAGKEKPFEIMLFQLPPSGEGNDSFHGYPLLSIETDRDVDIVLVPSFVTNDMKATIANNRQFLPWLQKHHQSGSEIASFCTGAFLLAASGLLNGRSATTHVDASNGFAVAFPEVILKPEQTLTVDDRLYTSGGSTSSFHLLILFVQKYCGNEMAVRIAKIFAVDMDRYQQSYFGTFRPSYTHMDELVAQIQRNIEVNYMEIETIEAVIKDIPASRRNIVRRFKQATGIPPIEYLQQIRVESAKKLFEQTNQNIAEVIINTGYTDPKSFRKVFRKIVGMTPVEYRDKFKLK